MFCGKIGDDDHKIRAMRGSGGVADYLPQNIGRTFRKTIRYDKKSPWRILFQIKGSIWPNVLPYCILNCALLLALALLRYCGITISFSPNGHALMTLIISYLVVSKVNLAFDRYMQARDAVGSALCALRELHQLVILYTLNERTKVADLWRGNVKRKIISLLDCTMHVIRDEEHATYLAKDTLPSFKEDPMIRLQILRNLLYNGILELDTKLELLERAKMIDMLNDFAYSYRQLLKLASTPIPFPLVQMGRTFLFIWTFSIPFVLLGIVNELVSASFFIFFLTYGFLGLEYVAMKLMDPFGDGVNDLNVVGMREATIRGIENDYALFEGDFQQKSFEQLEELHDSSLPLKVTTENKKDSSTSTEIKIDDRYRASYHEMGDM